MFDKKDRNKVISFAENERKIANNIKKRSITIYKENLDKLLEINNKLDFNVIKNGYTIPNFKKTLEYVFQNFDYDKETNSNIDTCQDSKLITIYFDDETLSNIEKFAEKNKIFKAKINININLAVNYIIKHF